MKQRFFTKTFTKFFFAFVIIVGAAFGLLITVAAIYPPSPVDSVAQPR